ncbi:DNA translocase FtsK [Streptomyces hydrogenans]|uniref:DNA translocase FtsK n=1 Tax=Streptomyces hydrogenans TaxID=1873719 RepID=UPI0036E51F7E
MNTPRRTDNILRTAADLVTETRRGCPIMLQRRFNHDKKIFLGYQAAHTLLDDLQAAGIVGYPATRAYRAHRVLMDRATAAAALNACTDRVQAWTTLYECRSCYRASPWTNLGNETDEFWCPDCEDTVPISDCRVITSA